MNYRSLARSDADTRLLAFPPPYRAWLTIANDPDCTTIDAWTQLHQCIWSDLALPLADTFFLTSHNERWPDQVNLADHPHIIDAHPHDAMHTWGDFLQSKSIRFHRQMGIDGLKRLRELQLVPRIWIDHSGSPGNLLHRASRKSKPLLIDAAGHEYDNLEYTLDLIVEAGVRYVWDGDVTSVIGQDRMVTRREHYGHGHRSSWKPLVKAALDRFGRRVWDSLEAKLFDYDNAGNDPYRAHRFEDGNQLYRFRRYGTWVDADIDGLANRIAPGVIDRLQEVGGVSVVYTHLGKRKASRSDDAEHLPPQTIDALRGLARRYRDQDLMLSGTARLLDYLVLRDHAVVSADRVDFRSDGIRFASLCRDDMSGMAFGVKTSRHDLQVSCDGHPVDVDFEDHGDGVLKMIFSETPVADQPNAQSPSVNES